MVTNKANLIPPRGEKHVIFIKVLVFSVNVESLALANLQSVIKKLLNSDFNFKSV